MIHKSAFKGGRILLIALVVGVTPLVAGGPHGASYYRHSNHLQHHLRSPSHHGLHLHHYLHGHPFFVCSTYYPPRPSYSLARLLARRAELDQGGVDLNVRPRRAKVWADDIYLGTSNRMDGSPDFLWLGEGTHELLFEREGYRPERREVVIIPGHLTDLKVRLEKKRAPEGSPTHR